MIETKQQVANAFQAAAEAFLSQPNAMTGIDFDDAVVALKRYALSELKDQELGSELARLPKLIRALDVASIASLVDDVQRRLAD